MGKDGHVLTFPVDHGQILNIVAFKTDSGDWPDPNRLVRPAQQQDLVKDFSDFGPMVRKLLSLTKANVDVVCNLFRPRDAILILRSGQSLI